VRDETWERVWRYEFGGVKKSPAVAVVAGGIWHAMKGDDLHLSFLDCGELRSSHSCAESAWRATIISHKNYTKKWLRVWGRTNSITHLNGTVRSRSRMVIVIYNLLLLRRESDFQRGDGLRLPFRRRHIF
jgi:hypothetical protein